MIFEWKALKGQLFQKSKSVKTSQEVLEGWQMLIKTAPETIAAILELVKHILTISVSTAEQGRIRGLRGLGLIYFGGLGLIYFGSP